MSGDSSTEMRIGQGFEQQARNWPDRLCVIEGEYCTTYGAIDRSATRLALRLLEQGVRPGDRVMILLPSSTDFVTAYLGTLRAGAIAVPLHPESGTREIQRRREHCDAALTIVGAEGPNRSEDDDLVVRVDSSIRNGSSLQESLPTLPQRSGDDPALILYTSGSTGEPKGVTLSHRNLESNTWSILAYLELCSDDRALVVLPFSYAYGLSVLHTHLWRGASLVIETQALFPNSVLATLRRERITGFPGVPSTFLLLLARGDFEDFDSPALRYLTCAGGRLSSPSVRALRQVLPSADLILMYGATEASARLSYLPPEWLETKPESIGRPIDGVKFEIRQANRALADGEEGELWARGPNLALGYWPVDEDEAFLEDGWYNTGDLAWRDDMGCYHLVGRANQLVKIGGHRVSLLEVEAALHALDAVMDCAVVAGLHPVAGEQIEAHVVPVSPDVEAADLAAELRQVLPWFKRPARLHLTEALPLSVNGKVLRHLLRPADDEDTRGAAQ